MTIRYSIDRWELNSRDMSEEVQWWCYDHFGELAWSVDLPSNKNKLEFTFAHEKDAMLFLLRWGSLKGVYDTDNSEVART